MSSPDGARLSTPASAWAPLASPVFRALWIAQFASNIGTWMQTVGAQWLLVDSSALILALVQTASSLPIMLLALPAGAWADLFNRKKLLIGAQATMFVAAATLAAITFLGTPSPIAILALTFALGCGNAVAGPSWQAIQPDLVERRLLPQAAALNGLNMNVARAIGPAIGGFVVALVGPGWVFALNAISFVGISAAVFAWRRPAQEDTGPRERMGEALVAGGRYVRNALIVRRILYRSLLFIPAASAVWALLPLVAADRLGLGSGGYGVLLAMVGFGAVLGAVVIPRIRARVGSPRLVTAAMVVAAAAVLVVGIAPNSIVVGLALIPIGGSWIAIMSSLNSSLQLALPNWVRGRGLAYYLVVFQGAQAIGAMIWGSVADLTSVPAALMIAAGALALGALVGLRSPLPDTSNLDRTPSVHWPTPELSLAPGGTDGPVLVTIEYRVLPENAIAFSEAMQHVGRSRRRTGALRWELFRDGNDPDRFVELYLVGTWAEHQRQHSHRLTGGDRKFEEVARSYSEVEPVVAHLFPAPVPPKSRGPRQLPTPLGTRPRREETG